VSLTTNLAGSNRRRTSRSSTNGLSAAVFGAIAVAGCGGRSAFWSGTVDSAPPAFDLGNAVALVDAAADRVVLLTPGAEQALATTSIPVGRDILGAAVSADGGKLFVVSGGHRAAIGDDEPDQAPSLTVIAPGAGASAQRYDLQKGTDPMAGLAIDPSGRWVVLYPGSGGSQPFVENPNELVIVDVSTPPGATTPVPHTLMSFGGRPQRFTFTPTLPSPVNHPLLIVESDQNLSLLQLDNPATPEISVPLTNGSDTRLLSPAGVTVYPGDAANGARVGVRLANDSNVVMLQFVPETDASGASTGNGFLPTINLDDVGGIASDIAFVHTDSGLKLAALVPSQSKATLIDPASSLTQDVALPVPYQRLSLVTGATGAADACAGTTSTTATTTTAPADVAILWNGSSSAGQSGVAFWELGQTGCTPYRSIDTVGITAEIGNVVAVPPPNQTLEVLAANDGNSFYVLNLANRTAAPFVTSTAGTALSVSPLGDQVWTYVPNGVNVAATDFTDEHPRSLLIERPVSQVFEVARTGGSPAVVVLHDEGGVGATVYDASTLDDSTRRLYAGILLGGAP
jgi:hypothetical protein